MRGDSCTAAGGEVAGLLMPSGARAKGPRRPAVNRRILHDLAIARVERRQMLRQAGRVSSTVLEGLQAPETAKPAGRAGRASARGRGIS
jgi:hypothetical protein